MDQAGNMEPVLGDQDDVPTMGKPTLESYQLWYQVLSLSLG